jgi:D-3-phosphoglycerate dehydrogenase
MRTLLDEGLMAAAPGLEVHDGDPNETDIPHLLHGVNIVLNGHTVMRASLLERCADLSDIIFLGTGASSYIDLQAAERLGVAVHTIHDYGSRSVAEHAMALALAGARQMAAMDRDLRAGHWQPRQGFSLAGRVLSVLGAGPIGRELIRLGADFGMSVQAWSRGGVGSDLPCRGVCFDEALRGGDVVSLHLALTPETAGIIGQRALGLMQPGAILVNTARGGLIDEAALVRSLRSGRPGHAALDVFETEPLPEGHPLCGLANVTLTAHSGFNTTDAAYALLEQALGLLADMCSPDKADGRLDGTRGRPPTLE